MKMATEKGLLELDRKTKIELLLSIKKGEVNPKDLTPDAIIVANPKGGFMAMQIGVAYRRKGEQCPPIIHIGEAAKTQISPDLLAKVAERRAKNM